MLFPLQLFESESQCLSRMLPFVPVYFSLIFMAPKCDNKWSKWHVGRFNHCFTLEKWAWMTFLLIDDCLNSQRDSNIAWEDFWFLPRESIICILQRSLFYNWHISKNCCLEGREDNLKEWTLMRADTICGHCHHVTLVQPMSFITANRGPKQVLTTSPWHYQQRIFFLIWHKKCNFNR